MVFSSRFLKQIQVLDSYYLKPTGEYKRLHILGRLEYLEAPDRTLEVKNAKLKRIKEDEAGGLCRSQAYHLGFTCQIFTVFRCTLRFSVFLLGRGSKHVFYL